MENILPSLELFLSADMHLISLEWKWRIMAHRVKKKDCFMQPSLHPYIPLYAEVED